MLSSEGKTLYNPICYLQLCHGAWEKGFCNSAIFEETL